MDRWVDVIKPGTLLMQIVDMGIYMFTVKFFHLYGVLENFIRKCLKIFLKIGGMYGPFLSCLK